MDGPPATTLRPAQAEAVQGQRRAQVTARGALESLLVLFCLVLWTWRWWELGPGDFGFGSNYLADVATVRRTVYKRQSSGKQAALWNFPVCSAPAETGGLLSPRGTTTLF